MKKLYMAILALLAGGLLLAQTDIRVFRADSTSGGSSVVGKLVLLPDTLAFVDDERPEASVAVPKSGIQSLENENDLVTIQLRQSVRDRAGSTNRLMMRLTTQAEASSVARWWGGATTGTAAAAGGGAAEATSGDEMVFSASRKKRFRGNTAGKLIIKDDRVIFDSVDNISDSRQWALRDIKEMKLKNPYELEIDPFDGNKYTLELIGQGMSTDQYRELVNRVTQARTAR
jgi:hypothetical protein